MTGVRERDALSESSAGSATRERILAAAAKLFARHGYHATTTRQIADAVGIRQPSLFHHFRSKAAIVESLLEWDLGRAIPRTRAIAASSEPAAVRLFRYLRADVVHLTTAPYNLSGIYAEDVMSDPDFAAWAARRSELHGVVEAIVRDGLLHDEFIRVDPALVRDAIAGILIRALTLHSGRGEDERTVGDIGDEVARLIVRGLLVEPGRIDAVAAAAKADARAGARGACRP